MDLTNIRGGGSVMRGYPIKINSYSMRGRFSVEGLLRRVTYFAGIAEVTWRSVAIKNPPPR